ncbi:MAG: acyl-CoA dehydrogenase [Nevskia sp.]|uniref:acyl-CoA dehydrogenase n=1 Tax=Nevskia sp. TaxID=1929292 RepID=UPI004036D79B
MDNDALQLFEETLARYNRERYDAGQWRDYGRLPQGHSPERWAELQAMGCFELLRPEDDEHAAPLADLLPLYAAAGEARWREPLATVFAEPVAVIGQVGDPARRRALLEGLISGAQPLGYAHRETGGEGIATTASRCAAGWRLDGDKAMVIGADICNGFLVSAIDAERGLPAMFLVDAAAPGLHLQRYRTIDDGVAADLRFEQTPAEWLCDGTAAIAAADARGVILAAAEALGMMRGANRDSTEYLRERRQFGQPLLGFQALQHRLVEMLMRQRECEALVASVAEAFDHAAPALSRQVLVLRVQVARALRHITREAVQLHGGMGVTQELRIGRYYRRALMLDSLHGTADQALDALSEHP